MAEQNTAFQTNLTEGSVPKKLLFFALPYLAAMLLQAFYNVADMMIVGWFCSDAGIAAVGTAGNITIMLTNMIAGLATGGTVLIAQYIGSKRYEDEKKTIATLFTAYGLVAVVMTAVLLPLVPAICACSIPHRRRRLTPNSICTSAWAAPSSCLATTPFRPCCAAWAIPKAPCCLWPLRRSPTSFWTTCSLGRLAWARPARPLPSEKGWIFSNFA